MKLGRGQDQNRWRPRRDLKLKMRFLGRAGHMRLSEGNFLFIFLNPPMLFSQLVRLCNEGARKMERTEMMYTINSQLEFKIKVACCLCLLYCCCLNLI